MIKQNINLTNINLTFYLTVAKLDGNKDAESLVGDISSVSDWSYAIPYLLIEDEKAF